LSLQERNKERRREGGKKGRIIKMKNGVQKGGTKYEKKSRGKVKVKLSLCFN
jgi:hypothetical protein